MEDYNHFVNKQKNKEQEKNLNTNETSVVCSWTHDSEKYLNSNAD